MMLQSISSGARQDHNKIARGYYRTDDKTTQGICNALGLKNPQQPAVLFDPCCGEGIVMRDLSRSLDNECVTYGVEIEGSRFLASHEKLTQVLHGDALYLISSSSWAGLLYFNPPYGTTKNRHDESVRLEQLFWEAHASRLLPGGVLVAVLPDYLFYRECPRMAEYFSNFLEKGSSVVYRATTDEFKQIVIIRYRRVKTLGAALDPDIDLRNLLLNPNAELPDLPDTPLEAPFLIPAGYAPDVFRVNHLTQETVDVLLQKDGNRFVREIEDMLKTEQAVTQKIRSVTQIREGHIPALLASGGLDGIVEDAHGRFLVRGTVNTVLHVDNQESLDKKIAEQKKKAGQGPSLSKTEKDVRKTITTRRHETRIMAWDLLNNFNLISVE